MHLLSKVDDLILAITGDITICQTCFTMIARDIDTCQNHKTLCNNDVTSSLAGLPHRILSKHCSGCMNLR